MRDQSFTLRRGQRNPAPVLDCIASAPEDCDLVVTVAKLKKERSDAQNRALWGCAYEHLRQATGNDKPDLHEYFCGEYWGWDIKPVMGMKKKQPKRTTTTGYDGERDVISTLHLSDFYGFIQQRSAELGYYVPDPDPRWFEREERRVA